MPSSLYFRAYELSHQHLHHDLIRHSAPDPCSAPSDGPTPEWKLGSTLGRTPREPNNTSLPTPSMPIRDENPLHSLIAGMIAGGTEAFVTYPAEFVKTRAQFGGQRESMLSIISTTVREKGIPGLYSGCSALVIGHAVKAGVRFVSYEYFKGFLADAEGNISVPKNLVAGVGAGMVEAILAVTPSETIKTKLIDDAKRPDPQYRSLLHGTVSIVRHEGVTGVYQGLVPVMLRQGVISALRFTTYDTLKEYIESTAPPGQQISSGVTFGMGAVAGIVTVYLTQPLDVIKTRMQTLDALYEYRNAFHCGYRIVAEEGVTRLWTGAIPRLAALVVGGGIFFTVYENVIRVIG